MSRRSRPMTLLGVVAVLVLGLIGPVAAQAPVKVGVVLPLSGRNAVAGQSNLFGMRLVADAMNAAGGVRSLGGAKLEFIVADNASAAVSSAGGQADAQSADDRAGHRPPPTDDEAGIVGTIGRLVGREKSSPAPGGGAA